MMTIRSEWNEAPGAVTLIDAHHHLWDLKANRYPFLTDQPEPHFFLGPYDAIKRNYLPEDYLRDSSAHNVLTTVHCEAEMDRSRQVAETRWLTEVNARYGFPGAIVAHAWFHTENAEEIIAAQSQFPLVRGIRSKPVTSLRPGTGTPGAPGTMQDDKWLRGFALLEKYGLSWDLRVPYWHLAEAAEVARQFPRTPIVLNHTGFPWDRSEEGLAAWRRGMEAVAREPNVHVKVSEFGLKDSAWDYEFEPTGRHGCDCDFRHGTMHLREQFPRCRIADRLRHARPLSRPHARGPFAGRSRPLLLEECRVVLPSLGRLRDRARVPRMGGDAWRGQARERRQRSPCGPELHPSCGCRSRYG